PEFVPNAVFHIYNRTNNKEHLFLDDQDRWHFFYTYRKFLMPYVRMYAYCLLDNHFHFQIRIKRTLEIKESCKMEFPINLSKAQKYFLEDIDNEVLVSKLVSWQFSRFFDSYSKYFNLKHNRKGNLFNRPFKRKMVEDENYFRNLICYIHTNPLKHYGMEDYQEYPWSSFQPMLNRDVFIPLEYAEIDSLFGSEASFFEAHQAWIELTRPSIFAFE
ncbi:MAG: hypothetical protein KDC34_04425, partial [Saprospiraceae bacterium]|nr:hypothetical protein [Saprospiraceae bacterium]